MSFVSTRRCSFAIDERFVQPDFLQESRKRRSAGKIGHAASAARCQRRAAVGIQITGRAGIGGIIGLRHGRRRSGVGRRHGVLRRRSVSWRRRRRGSVGRRRRGVCRSGAVRRRSVRRRRRSIRRCAARGRWSVSWRAAVGRRSIGWSRTVGRRGVRSSAPEAGNPRLA